MDSPNTKLLSNAFYALLLQNLSDSSRFNIKLTQIERNWGEAFMTLCPEFIVNITKSIQNTITNKIICLHDIPSIIKKIAKIINNYALKLEMNNLDNIKVFIKLIIYTIIDSELFLNDLIDFNTLEIMLNNSLDLLFFNLTVIESQPEPETCLNYIQRCFTLYYTFRHLKLRI